MDSPASPVTLLAGLPEAWTIKLARGGPESPTTVVQLADGRHPVVDGSLPIPVASDWSDATTALNQFRDTGNHIGMAIIGALAAPVAHSLDDAQQALEAAVAMNAFAPLNLLAALLPDMMARRSGRLLLITWNPASQSRPEDAAARGSARGVLTYLESLRPALRQRGIVAGTLLLAPRRMEEWNAAAVAPPVIAAVQQCLRQGTPQRVLKVG